ncbi:methyltransferase domain-containing protein [Orrella sp. 11846]|uniref:methyltransferase domain-containing protein n=1 Tax=Orrella sp. 11846 TaxID=3409913 RepID=UPI003B58D64E
MDEATKTNIVRGPGFADLYLRGKVIDIGCGRDPVCSWAEPFDLEHGDAGQIDMLREIEAYDAVHSSHCLEHMPDPADALVRWWRLVKPGGYLIIVVPDEDLYEQGFFPSRFNDDHKATFRMGGQTSWSPVSHDIVALISSLEGAEIIDARIQDQHYDWSLRHHPYQAAENKPWQRYKRRRKLLRILAKPLGRAKRDALTREFEDRWFREHGIPVDQTAREALAQIQVIARKIKTGS